MRQHASLPWHVDDSPNHLRHLAFSPSPRPDRRIRALPVTLRCVTMRQVRYGQAVSCAAIFSSFHEPQPNVPEPDACDRARSDPKGSNLIPFASLSSRTFFIVDRNGAEFGCSRPQIRTTGSASYARFGLFCASLQPLSQRQQPPQTFRSGTGAMVWSSRHKIDNRPFDLSPAISWPADPARGDPEQSAPDHVWAGLPQARSAR